MARKDEAATLLRSGYTPSEIAHNMNISPSSVWQYLCTKVGEGGLRRSQILFSLDDKTRSEIDKLTDKLNVDDPRVIAKNVSKEITPDDVRIYLELRNAGVAWGDMYEYIRDIELALHKFIGNTLQTAYEDNWWRKAIPEKIRVECATLREMDSEPIDDPYCYTNFIHLKKIMKKEWQLFLQHLPKELSSKQSILFDNLTTLNRIRNVVMHPVKNISIRQEDLSFVHYCWTLFNSL